MCSSTPPPALIEFGSTPTIKIQENTRLNPARIMMRKYYGAPETKSSRR
jgi:hypothetical protein